MSEFEGELMTCIDCGRDFVWSAGERELYQQKCDAPPELCRECRRARHERRGDAERKGGEE